MYSKEELLIRLQLGVFKVNGALLENGDEMVAPIGLTSSRWQVLGAIALAGQPLTAPQIGEAMGISRQGVQKQLNRMLDEGLLARDANPRHERSPLYGLSPAGQRAYDAAIALNHRWVAKMARGFSIDELKTTVHTLEHFLAQLAQAVPTPESET